MCLLSAFQQGTWLVPRVPDVLCGTHLPASGRSSGSECSNITFYHHEPAVAMGLAFSTKGHLSWLDLALATKSRALWVPCDWGQVSYGVEKPATPDLKLVTGVQPLALSHLGDCEVGKQKRAFGDITIPKALSPLHKSPLSLSPRPGSSLFSVMLSFLS